MKKTFNYMHFALVPVELEVLINFRSSSDKQQFINQHFLFPDATYDVYKDHAYEHLYYVIDLSHMGCILNKDEPLVFSECKKLIEHYL